jgi:signal recognition particle subunit SRP54
MTKQERKNPDILDISRLKRVARGCGRSLEDIEAFYDRFLQARVMMTQLGQSGMLANMMKGKGGMPNMGGGGGFPNMGGGGFPNMGGGFPNMRQQKKPKRSPEEKAKRLAESRKRLKLKKKKKR